MNDRTPPEQAEEFSLFLGGPLYQLFIRLGLIKPPLDRLRWRLIVITAIVWAPLFSSSPFSTGASSAA